ncbi:MULTISPECIES: small, acid-soluble spore protein, alpha/beta type [unclassified Romboutsia]|uniref:small, acid-soluble spore protein, alpha/beta type n=1 Tax=unclassified Romboutsia TaxID=2626894 RepID=UPI0008217112|nr:MULTISPECIES: small, acid-soluble spore protein, alpha/beta type [unclassified Romboutsia]SCH66681.1 Small%2C acid-soluble spore protein beta [uncultured Clostridium sp.]
MKNKINNSNAKVALNMMKMEVANELGYSYDELNDKVECNSPQNTLEGIAKNVLAGEQVGGKMTKNLVEMAEKSLLNNYRPK